jgi:pyruvate ferredoxin oxidoreductase gamma subunit/phenylglyoxylate dehydrogenase gamma subunit
VDIFKGVNDNAIWVQTTKKNVERLTYPPQIKKIGLCDAVSLATEVLGRPITNTIMLGVFAKTTGLVSLGSINKAMESVAFRDALLDKNILAVQRGYEQTTTYDVN